MAFVLIGGLMFVWSAMPLSAHAETAARAAKDIESVSEHRRGNICFGGLENGKLIPNNDRVDNPFRQTTLLGCAVEGGEPVFLPDLKPAFPNGVLA